MTTNKEAGALQLIDDLVEELRLRETPLTRKANTVTTTIGTVATFLATIAAAWVESGTNVPSWVPLVVLVLGMIGTTYGVAKTKNGMTSSVALKLRDGLAERIDVNHLHELQTQTQVDPPTVQFRPVDQVLDLKAQADGMLFDLMHRRR